MIRISARGAQRSIGLSIASTSQNLRRTVGMPCITSATERVFHTTLCSLNCGTRGRLLPDHNLPVRRLATGEGNDSHGDVENLLAVLDQVSHVSERVSKQASVRRKDGNRLSQHLNTTEERQDRFAHRRRKQLRISTRLERALGIMFAEDRVDVHPFEPRNISVLEVDISPDLRQATVHIDYCDLRSFEATAAYMGKESAMEILSGAQKELLLGKLKRCSNRLRLRIAHSLRLRVAPALTWTFKNDSSGEKVKETKRLLKIISAQMDVMDDGQS